MQRNNIAHCIDCYIDCWHKEARILTVSLSFMLFNVNLKYLKFCPACLESRRKCYCCRVSIFRFSGSCQASCYVKELLAKWSLFQSTAISPCVFYNTVVVVILFKVGMRLCLAYGVIFIKYECYQITFATTCKVFSRCREKGHLTCHWTLKSFSSCKLFSQRFSISFLKRVEWLMLLTDLEKWYGTLTLHASKWWNGRNLSSLLKILLRHFTLKQSCSFI